MADLVGEGYIVGVSCPRYSGMLAGAGIHGMEGIGRLRAGGGRWVVVDLGESIGGARRHGAGLVARQVMNVYLETGGGVVEVNRDLIA